VEEILVQNMDFHIQGPSRDLVVGIGGCLFVRQGRGAGMGEGRGKIGYEGGEKGGRPQVKNTHNSPRGNCPLFRKKAPQRVVMVCLGSKPGRKKNARDGEGEWEKKKKNGVSWE